MGYVLLGLGFSGLLAGLLPFGCLGSTMRHDDSSSPALMTALALPLYLGPLPGMMRLGLMFEHGNSVGAAFVLFEVGIGVNLGLIVWLLKLFGGRRVLLWLVLVTAGTLALGYVGERRLYFAAEEVSHTHAFDEWTSPFPWGSEASLQTIRDKLLQKVEVLESVALCGMALLLLVGLLARKLDREGRLESWLTAPPPPAPPGLFNRELPGPVLGLAALLGLVVFSVAALYVYYPPPEVAFKEMYEVRGKALPAVTSGHKEEAIRRLEQWDLLTRKLQVGVLIRTGSLPAEAREHAEDLRERLEDVRDALLGKRSESPRDLLKPLEASYYRCRQTFLGTPPPPGFRAAKR